MFAKELITSYPEAATFLTNAILKNKLANSYVFIGKDSAASLSLAINLAQILNCNQNKGDIKTPCKSCINCKWLEKNEHPQALMIISPDQKSKKDQIKIEVIRELLNTLSRTSDYFRVVFFQSSNLNTLPKESCNLLLKTVEETPPNTIFIFANKIKSEILPTILSRSQTIYINKTSNSIHELIDESITQSNKNLITDCYSQDIKTSLEKARMVQEYLSKSKITLHDFLINLAITSYDLNKVNAPKKFCTLYKNLSIANLKSKSFMQPKIVIEDLFLSLLTA